jgi:hypothetical protein
MVIVVSRVMPYFRLNEDTGNYEKTIMINKERWRLIVYPSIWSRNTSKAVSGWISAIQNGKNPIFRWGEIDKGDTSAQIVEYEPHPCISCGKVYGSRSGLWKHERLCTILNSKLRNTREYTNHTTVEAGGTQINNNGIHNTININIRDFGKENPAWLTENFLFSILGDVDRAIPMLMKKKHFNENFPENMNLRLNTRSDINKRLQVRENGKWRLRDSKQTFYKVVLETYEILCDALTEDEEVFDGTHPEIEKARRSEKFLEKVNQIRPIWEEFHKRILSEEDPETMRELWEDLKTLLLDRQLCAEQD